MFREVGRFIRSLSFEFQSTLQSAVAMSSTADFFTDEADEEVFQVQTTKFISPAPDPKYQYSHGVATPVEQVCIFI